MSRQSQNAWWAWCPVVLVVGSAPALAQDDDLPDGEPTSAPVEVEAGATFDFDVNSVLVASFEAAQPFLEPEAERVRKLVEKALAQGYVVVAMSEVPAFTDYSAEIYLRSCPQGQYIGCVFVVGGRAETDWTIGGSIAAVEGGYKVDLSFIDVDEAKLVLEFDTVLDGSNDAEFQEGVSRVMDALVQGNVQDLDIRGDPEAQRVAEKEAKQRADAAKQFAAESVYEDVGEDIERGAVGEDAYVGRDESRPEEPDERTASDRGKVTSEDLEAMESRGGLTPWERAGLTKSQYKLYRNSGKKLRDFKARLQGRKGEVIVRVGFGVSNGPWGQANGTGLRFKDGVGANETPVSDNITSQTGLQLQTQRLTYGGQLEFGGGVTSWLEILGFAGIGASPYQYIYVVDTNGLEHDMPDPTGVGKSAWHAGLKLGFVPMPAYPARPTVHISGSWWQGSRIGKVVDYSAAPALYASQMPSNNMIVATLEPGFEVSAGKMITIFARAQLDLVVGGRYFQNVSGQPWPAYAYEADMANAFGSGLFAITSDGHVTNKKLGIGIGANVGVTFRFRVAGLR